MAEELVNMEFIDLNRCIRNTSSNTSASRTPDESGQQYLTRGKEYIEPHKTW